MRTFISFKKLSPRSRGRISVFMAAVLTVTPLLLPLTTFAAETLPATSNAFHTPIADKTTTPAATPTKGMYTRTVISGYVASDLILSSDGTAEFKKGFSVYTWVSSKRVVTDEKGYFIFDVLSKDKTLVLTISKPGYLKRELSIDVGKDITLGTVEKPVLMWAGDVIQDGAINMNDIMEVASSFNSVSADGRYKENLDINLDNAVNMSDIIILAKHFNATSNDYPVS